MGLAAHALDRLASRLGLDVARGEVTGDTFLEIAGRRLFYQERGDPRHPALFFLHGAGASPSDLPVLLEGFAARGFFALAPEHPGMGRSEHLPSYEPDPFRAYARAYIELLRRKHLARPIVVAQSFGGGPAGVLAELAREARLGARGDQEPLPSELSPSALVLVDALMGQRPSRRGVSGLYGWLLRHLGVLLRVSPRRIGRLLTSTFSGTPAAYYRGDLEGDGRLALALGRVFGAFARGAPPVEVDYAGFVLSGEGRPLILVWGEHDGTRLLDNGEWGSRLTAIGDARALHERVLAEVADALRERGEDEAVARQQAHRLVRFAVVPGAGHAGLYTRSHMEAYLEGIAGQLTACGLGRSHIA